jgi:hypothetical protein
MPIHDKIRRLADEYRDRLLLSVDARVREMEGDDTSHFLSYQVLGVPSKEGKLIDVYQNKGRFLYKYAGAFLEEATKMCFKEAFPDAQTAKVPNTRGNRPKAFEIDCLVGRLAHEIKWRDATTDGDHITKEHTRIMAIADAGHRPIRVMFYYPSRSQAMKVQRAIQALYASVGGEYHFQDAAWDYLASKTGIRLKHILEQITAERVGSSA